MVTACGVSNKAQKSADKDRKIVVGISHNGGSASGCPAFTKCIQDAGAEVFIFPTYPENDSIMNAYLDMVDCLIIPGSNVKDTINRKVYDRKIIAEALYRGMPLLGVCEGHQRINQVLGGVMDKIEKHFPGLTPNHRIYVDGKNVGVNTEAHPAIIDRNSTLYRIFGEDTMMVNTSHSWCTPVMSPKLTVTAVAPDGIVESYEAPHVMGVQWHPEVLYGRLGIEKWLKLFQWFVEEGRQYRDDRAARKVVIGISRNGIPEYKRYNFANCIHDAGAEVYFFPTFPENDEIMNSYLDKVDCLIIPGSGSDDPENRRDYDKRIILSAIDRGMPLLGICEGHQRINQVLGGTLDKIKNHYPGCEGTHSIHKDGKNIGAQMEAHPIYIEKNSTLYKIFGVDTLMVNTSHGWCTPKMSEKLRVTAVAPDGIVEAYEADNIWGLQWHPEYMYGDMHLEKFLKVFTWFKNEGLKYKESRK